ncbi:hypothetical protein HOI83_01300 [Candidatus Uhrbacteria bacterium]|jgi:hypothetical protein|nr:hypothetical protein [Candidatus Uhrbacteria bacterium]
MIIPKRLLLTLCTILIVGAGCISPGSTQDIVQASYLPDHITEIFGETLPQAVLEARQRNKNSVTITDASGNLIIADISDPTHTVFVMTDPTEVEDPIELLISFLVPLEKAYDVKRGNGTFSFNLNEVRSAEIASIMYEISVKVFHTPTTQEWVIDIQ